MTVGGDLASQCKVRGRIQRLRDGVDELLHRDKVLSLAISKVLQMNTGEGVGISFEPRLLLKSNERGKSAPWYQRETEGPRLEVRFL